MVKNHYDALENGIKSHKKSKLTDLIMDELDMKIIDLMAQGNNNKQIASEIKVPLSTIQRRTKRLTSNKAIIHKTEINYRKFGYKKGVLHLYVIDNDVKKLSVELLNMAGIISTEIHIGNSDILCNMVYKDNQQLFEIIN